MKRPTLDYDITIDEEGNGHFNALPLFYRLKNVIDDVLGPTNAEIVEHAEQNDITPAQAKLTLREASKAEIERCYQHSLPLLQNKFKKEFAPLMEIELRKLAEGVAHSTLARPEYKPGSRTKARSVSRKLRSRDRRRLGRHGPGRPAGSKTGRNPIKVQQTLAQRKEKMLGAMRRLFGDSADRETLLAESKMGSTNSR